MRIKFIQLSNFRKLKSTHIDFDARTTVFVGANNSGKTSAMVALRYFLLSPERLSLRDVTIGNWIQIDELGKAWEEERESVIQLDDLLPSLDVWLEARIAEIQYLVHILPTLDWPGGLLGVRLKFHVKHVEKLKTEYLHYRKAAREAAAHTPDSQDFKLQVWPKCLTGFLEKRLRKHVELRAFPLDPAAWIAPQKGVAVPQVLPATAIPLDSDPLKRLIKVDEIPAQRDFDDVGESAQGYGARDSGSRRFRRRLSEQLRSYYDNHIDPSESPSSEDYQALGAIQWAEVNFDKRLADGFASALRELEDLGYPGIENPKIKISTQLHPADGLRHNSAVQYQIAGPTGDGASELSLPEDYAGLGFQNLIGMAFRLMSYRNEWMRVGKALAGEPNEQEPIQRLHLVLVEEPEAHLHAQVQQVFINKAYDLLRNHDELGLQEDLQTQLVISTHSSHVAHEVDFSSLRYFRRRPASSRGEIPTTTIANLSDVFGAEGDTYRFVKRYLRSTHCDLFFADGVIFIEGPAERILVPHFIRYHFPSLSRRYVTLLDIGGSHAHAFKSLVDELGLATLIIGDLDAVERRVPAEGTGEKIRWVAAKPRQGASQRTSNPVLKEWHPAILDIDELLILPLEQQESFSADGYRLFVTYQKPMTDDTGRVVIPRTFEDALILENLELVRGLKESPVGKKVDSLLASGGESQNLEGELFELLKTAEKAAFAIDCLMIENPLSLKPPRYIRDGLNWFERVVREESAENLPAVVTA